MEQRLTAPCALGRATPRQQRALRRCLTTSAAVLLALAAVTAVAVLASRGAPPPAGRERSQSQAALETAADRTSRQSAGEAAGQPGLGEGAAGKRSGAGAARGSALAGRGRPTLLQGRAPAAGSAPSLVLSAANASGSAGASQADPAAAEAAAGKCGDLRIPKVRGRSGLRLTRVGLSSQWRQAAALSAVVGATPKPGDLAGLLWSTSHAGFGLATGSLLRCETSARRRSSSLQLELAHSRGGPGMQARARGCRAAAGRGQQRPPRALAPRARRWRSCS
jgi:hypothetical protein